MFTTNTFSIRTNRGMGEYDPPGTYRDLGGGGGARRRAAGGGCSGDGRVAAVEKRKRAPSSVSVFRAPQQGRSARALSYCLSVVVTGSLLRFVRGNGGFSRPHPTSLSAVALALQSFALQREEKGRQKTRSGKLSFL